MSRGHNPPSIHPALVEAAPLGLDLSEEFCDANCREYHGVWGFLRLYGVLPAVSRDSDLVRKQVAEAATAGARRVLISGAADFGILSYVADGFAEAGKIAEITVADLCSTPLMLNEWYAAREGFAITTSAGNILDFSGGPFDLIVAHNFLNFFGAADRRRLVAKWAALLRPGGQLLVYNRIKPGAPERSRRFGEAGVARLMEKLRRARLGHPHAKMLDDARLVDLVTGYAQKRVTRNIRSEEELASLFHDAGLQIVSWTDTGNDAAGAYGDHGGPRVQIIAQRREGLRTPANASTVRRT